MTSKKFGIMGGTFDPIHLGHLVIANEVLNKYSLEKIIFIPAGKPPHKKGPKACSFDRFVMAELATLSNDKFTVSDIEIEKEEKSYTVNTIRELLSIYEDTEFYFITGADAVITLPDWHEADNLLKLCRIVAVSRPGFDISEIEKMLLKINAQNDTRIELLQVPMLQISSTDIRERIKNGMSVKYLLPESVEQYIIKNNLYAEIE